MYGCGSSRSHNAIGAKHDPSGKRWAITISGDTHASGLAIDVDSGGSAIVAGTFDGRLTLGASHLTSAGAQDGFVARFSSNGTPMWSKRFGGTSADRVAAVTIGDDGTAYVAGDFSAAAAFGAETLTAVGSSDGFVAAIDADGSIRWVTRIPSRGYASVSAIGLSTRGQIAVAGYFSGSLQSGDRALNSAGAHDVFVATFDPTGKIAWARRAGGSGADLARAVAVGPAGEIAIAGSFGDEADVLGLPLVSSSADDSAFVAMLTARGEPMWARGFGGAGIDIAHALAFGDDGQLYVAGSFFDRIAFDDRHALEAGNGPDAFIARLTRTGDHVWSARIGGSGADRGLAIAAGDESVVVAGTFEDALDFGDDQIASRGRTDVMVAELSDRGVPMWIRGLGGPGHDTVGGVGIDTDTAIAISGSFAGSIVIDGTSLAAQGGIAAFAAVLMP
jgi:hypothetical protein